MRLFGDRDLGAFPRQHPDGNFQSPAGWVHDTDRPISSLRSAKDPQSCTMKWVKWVEHLSIRIVRAQGIVGVDVTTRICTALSRAPQTPPRWVYLSNLRSRRRGRHRLSSNRKTTSPASCSRSKLSATPVSTLFS